MADMNTRREAAFIVARWIATHEYPADLLPDGPDRAFVQDLVYTTVRRFRPLRSTLGKLVATWPKGEMEALLLVGAAQILYMPDVPDFAAVNETVSAARKCPNPAIARVVNGVLRNLIRRRGEFEKALAEAPLAERESYPNALVKRWIARYGDAGAAALASWHNEPAVTFLARRDGSFEPLERGRRVADAAGFASGDFVVQDPATALAVTLLGVRPGQRVLDFCAAPGGKTAQIAWRLRPSAPAAGAPAPAAGRLLAHEVNPKRLGRLRENLKRLGLDWVETAQALPETARFDRVLADVPCSNTGVLRRRPDARWRWTVERLAEITALQDGVLAAAAAHVAPGGRLVYATCSNEPEENAERVAAFLAAHPDFKKVAERECVPHVARTDGAFACALERTGGEAART